MPCDVSILKLNNMVKYIEDDRVFSALAHPVRRSMLERLAEGSRGISELAEPYEMSLVAVSKHVHVLEEAGLVRIRKEGRTRVCRLDPGSLRPVATWVERFRVFWEHEMDQIDRFLDAAGEEDS